MTRVRCRGGEQIEERKKGETSQEERRWINRREEGERSDIGVVP